MKFFYTELATIPIKHKGAEIQWIPLGILAGMNTGLFSTDDPEVEASVRATKGSYEIKEDDFNQMAEAQKKTPSTLPASQPLMPKQQSPLPFQVQGDDAPPVVEARQEPEPKQSALGKFPSELLNLREVSSPNIIAKPKTKKGKS